MSSFSYTSARVTCAVCGNVAKKHDCRTGERGSAHCRRWPDPGSPPYGWTYAGKSDEQGFPIYWPDDGQSATDRRAAHATERVRAAKQAKATGGSSSQLSFEEIERRRRPLEGSEGPALVDRLLAGVATGAAALDSLEVRFMNDVHYSGQWAYVFPERDGDERTTGYNLRLRELTEVNGTLIVQADRKLTYGPRGLFIPRGWAATPGSLYVPEGASDTLALTAMGLAAVGRPSNIVGAELLAVLLRRYGFAAGEACETLPIIVLGENDAKPDGAWPGKEGAERVAGKLAELLGRAVTIAYPPDGFKDVRNLLEGNRDKLAAGRMTPADLGEEFAAWCASTGQTIGGTTPAITAPTLAGLELDTMAARLGGAIDRNYMPPATPLPSACPTPARLVLYNAAQQRMRIVIADCGRLSCPHCVHARRTLYLETIARRLHDAETDGLETVYMAFVPAEAWKRVGKHLSKAGADYFRVLLPDGRYLLAATSPPIAGDAFTVTAATVAEAKARLRAAVATIPLTDGAFASSRRWALLTDDEQGKPLGWECLNTARQPWQTVIDAHGLHATAATGRKKHFPERRAWEIDLRTLPRGMSYLHLASDLNAGYPTLPPRDADEDAGGGPEPIDYTTWGATGG